MLPKNKENKRAQQKGLEWVLGRSVRVKTLLDEEYEGEIYAYDLKTNCVVLHILLIFHQI